MEEVEVWLARDFDDTLNVYENKPRKLIGGWINKGYTFEIPKWAFSSIKYSDKEPTKAKITLIKL